MSVNPPEPPPARELKFIIGHGSMVQRAMTSRHIPYPLIILAALLAAASLAIVATDAPSDGEPPGSASYYYDQLQEYEKDVLDVLLSFDVDVLTTDPETGDPCSAVTFIVEIPSSFKGMKSDVVVEKYSKALEHLIAVMELEQPEHYWLGTYWHTKFVDAYVDSEDRFQSGSIRFYCEDCIFGYGSTKGAIKGNMAALELAAASVELADTSDRYSTVKSIHDYVCSLLTYDYAAGEGNECRNAYNALLGEHKVVCSGYARAFKIICDAWGVPNVLVSGEGVDYSKKPAESGPHMWNYVQMENGKWYLVDCTWDDSDPFDHYLLAGKGSMGISVRIEQDHIPEAYNGLKYPALASLGYLDGGYTATYRDIDGTVIAEYEGLDYGAAVPKPKDPVHTDPKVGTFEFTGWEPAVPAFAVSDLSFTAQYDIVYTDYSVRFLDDDGSVLSSKTDYHYGDALVKIPDPSKAETKDKRYVFLGWSTDGSTTVDLPKEVTESATYKAVYDVHSKGVFLGLDGPVLYAAIAAVILIIIAAAAVKARGRRGRSAVVTVRKVLVDPPDGLLGHPGGDP